MDNNSDRNRRAIQPRIVPTVEGNTIAQRAASSGSALRQARQHRGLRSAGGRDAAVGEQLERVIHDDPDARAWFYETYSGRLFRRLKGRYGHSLGLDPEELLQDSFLHFFQHDARVLSNFLERVPSEDRNEARLDGYLWGLACGIASNRRRSLKRRSDAGLPDDPSVIDPFDAERDCVNRDLVIRLTACVKRAGSRVFLYYKLRFVDGLTPAEITLVTGWSRKATYKLRLSLNEAVARCTKRLRILGR